MLDLPPEASCLVENTGFHGNVPVADTKPRPFASLYRSTALVALAITLNACAQGEEWHPPVRVVETGYWQAYAFSQAAYWLDADRVVFRANGQGQRAFGHAQLYLFDTRMPSARFLDNADYLDCAAGDQISYNIEHHGNDPKTWSVDIKKGAIGKERIIHGTFSKGHFQWPEGEPWRDAEGRLFNDYSCTYAQQPTIDGSRVVTRLFPEHGYLDFGKEHGSLTDPTSFVRASDGRRLPMPFTQGMANIDIRFYPFVGKYLVWNADMRRTKWREQGRLPAWWLSPDGSLEQFWVPAEPWATFGFSRLEHTARGYLVVIDRVQRGSRIGTSGLYLTDLRAGRYLTLVEGSIRKTSVSPDGCRVIFSEVPRIGDTLASGIPNSKVPYPSIPRWKAIDLCTDLPKGAINNG